MAKILAAGGAPTKTKTKTAVKPAKKTAKAAAALAKKASVKKPVKKKLRYPTDAEIERSRKAIAELVEEIRAEKAALGIVEPPKPEIVPLAEVEVLAAKAVKMIKAKKSLSPEKKAWHLADVANTLERARSKGGLSKGGVWDLKYPFGLGITIYDMKAVMR